ncbi:hypothetical protein [Streptacidiphilus carbonis]|uniref:hypothetical protein n=1 Tax=Streptacidiphilus carbonis TaxID=105422 RepID=UPI000B022C38|nr:hypothetical protein [Streptacidiphilus carbonis]
MSTPAVPLEANDENVAAAWLASITGLSADMVGTVLPPDVNADGSVASWIETGFVTVAVVGGNPDPMLPVSRPVVQVDCWATTPGSNKPPWNQALALSRAVLRATWDRYRIPRPLTPVVNGVAYPLAVVQSATVATAFRRMYDDQADYARVTGDVQLSWVMAHDTLP